MVWDERTLFGLFGLFSLVGVAFWVWALVDAIRVPDDSQYQSGTKVIWVLVIILANIAGALIYLVIGRPLRGKAGGGGGEARVEPPAGPPPPGPFMPPPPPPPST
jgi:hypothetical protein